MDHQLDRNGRTISRTYDGAGHLTAEIFVGESGQTESYNYTYGGSGHSPEQLSAVVDPTGRTEYDYGHMGRVSEVRYVTLHRTLDYTYDAAGHPLTLTLTDTTGQNAPVTETFQYDDLGRNDQLIDWNGNKFVYGYDAAGHVTRTEYYAKKGMALTRIATGRFVYDAADRLQSMTYRKGWSTTGLLLAMITPHTYDHAGKPAEPHEHGQPSDSIAITLWMSC